MWQRRRTRRRAHVKEYNHETSIYSRLVSHSARPSSLDDISVRSICGVAGALVRLSYFVSRRLWRIGFMTTSCAISTNKQSDEALVAATKRGDAQAFEELVL